MRCNGVFLLRSVADSNRRTRFCRPLPSHSANRPFQVAQKYKIIWFACNGGVFFICYWWDFLKNWASVQMTHSVEACQVRIGSDNRDKDTCRILDKTEHVHPKNGFSPGLKIAKNAIKKRSIAVQKRIKWPKTAKKTEHCHPVFHCLGKKIRKTEHCHPF